jgi:nitrate/nitrite transport system substrate-binding protein
VAPPGSLWQSVLVSFVLEVWGIMKPSLPRGPDGRPEHPIKADYLKAVIEKFRVAGRPFKMGMVSPVSTHN